MDEERSILSTVFCWKVNWIQHVLPTTLRHLGNSMSWKKNNNPVNRLFEAGVKILVAEMKEVAVEDDGEENVEITSA